jgi:activator of 2-hydroxyglutaryl-CoA dehydratase
MIGEALGEAVTVPEEPQLTGAYGAALLAIEGA